eukprot:TRINITY_DN3556_c0_g1_i1.p1 TRINITY_DN3556_c0_g1~~TRINITY_DN3556_c0_g1_i1.p1  ORF type:complete len:391 (+),score=146.85 TRINITY_DN3556_c0_g1_i1:111-1283(+)
MQREKKKKPVPSLAPVEQQKEFTITDSLTLQVQMPDGGQANVRRTGLQMPVTSPVRPPGQAAPAGSECSNNSSGKKSSGERGVPEALIKAPQREKFRFEDFKMGEVIGEGSQAKVRKVKHVPTKQLMALKIVAFGPELTRKVLQTELSRCSGVDNHPNLVASLEAFFKEGYLMVLMEYMAHGALSNLAARARKLQFPIPEEVLSHMTQEVLAGLHHLHTAGGGLIHRDLKPSNILVNADGVCKIADFGVATFLSQQQKMAFTAVGSTAYMSPERVRGDGYTTACDIWAVGLSVAELAIGHFPLGGKDSHTPLFELCSLIAEERATVHWPQVCTSGFPPSCELRDFVAKCMIQKPEKRPSAMQLLGHSFIKKHSAMEVDMVKWCRQAVGKA